MIKKNPPTPEAYIAALPEERKKAVSLLRKTILENLPSGFEETMGYGMIAYVVPHSLYPAGYHADPAQPLPFINIASQKNHITLYHMGLYASKELLDWFLAEYPKHLKSKPNMGKSCVRFKPPEIPYALIGKLIAAMKAEEWIALYEESINKRK